MTIGFDEWQDEIRRLRAENATDQNSITVKELMTEAGVAWDVAKARLDKLVADGRAVKVKKRVGPRISPSYQMVKKIR